MAGIWAGRRRNRGSILGRSKRCVPDPKLPGRLWDLSSILFSGYLGFSLGLKWPGHETGHLIHLVPRLGMTEAINIVSPPPVFLLGVERTSFTLYFYQALILEQK